VDLNAAPCGRFKGWGSNPPTVEKTPPPPFVFFAKLLPYGSFQPILHSDQGIPPPSLFARPFCNIPEENLATLLPLLRFGELFRKLLGPSGNPPVSILGAIFTFRVKADSSPGTPLSPDVLCPFSSEFFPSIQRVFKADVVSCNAHVVRRAFL